MPNLRLQGATPPVRPVYVYRAVPSRVVDGDTLDVQLDLGCHVWIHRRLRLLGVDAWEARGPRRQRGLAAKAFVEQAIAAAERLVVQTEMDAQGKYGRLLAWVHLLDTQDRCTCLNHLLVAQGHGRPSPPPRRPRAAATPRPQGTS